MAATKSIVLITGANAGLGFEVVKALLQSPKAYRIILSGRSLDKAQAAVQSARTEFPSSHSNLEAIQLDLENDDSMEKAYEDIANKHGQLDVLVNNAGMWKTSHFPLASIESELGGQFDPEWDSKHMSMREMWNKSWNVNTTGTQIVTYTFVPLLLKTASPRILFVTSGRSTLTGTEDSSLPWNKAPAKGWPKQGFSIPAYRSSKAGMNMMMRDWCRQLREDGVKVCCVSPGYLATGLGGNQEANQARGAIDPSIGGKLIRAVLEGERDDDDGKVIRANDVQPW